MKYQRTFLAAALLAGLGGMGIAAAATDSNSFVAKITIEDSCDVHTAGIADLDFGTHNFAATNITATTDITVKCSNNTAYDIGLTGSGAMANGSDTIAYQLFSDTGHSTTWGDTIGTDTVQDTGNGLDQIHTVYGLVPSIPATVPAGNYSDNVTVTVTY